MTTDTGCNQGRIGDASRRASVAALWPLLKHFQRFQREAEDCAEQDPPLLEPFEVPPLPRYFIVAFVAVMAFALIVASGGIDGWLQQLAAARR
jgi:hypothetical protein